MLNQWSNSIRFDHFQKDIIKKRIFFIVFIQQTAMYKINMINVQDLMSNMFTSDADFDDDNDDDDEDDDDDDDDDGQNGVNDDGDDDLSSAMGGGKLGNRAFHDRVILESSDDNANVHSVDKMKETESIFNYYNSHGSAALGAAAITTNEDDFGGGFANFGEVFGDGFGGESFGNDDDFGNNLLADIKFHKNTLQTDVVVDDKSMSSVSPPPPPSALQYEAVVVVTTDTKVDEFVMEKCGSAVAAAAAGVEDSQQPPPLPKSSPPSSFSIR